MSALAPGRKRRSSPARVLWIDLGGVVVRDPRPTVAEILRERAARRRDSLVRTYYALSRRLDVGAFDLRTMYDRLQTTFQLSLTYGEFRRLVGHLSLVAHASVLRALRRLRRDRSTRIVITSNVSRAVWQGLRRKLSIDRIAHDAVLSFRVGSLKPSRRFFREAIRRTGTDLAQVVFLDDDGRNTRAARSLGVETFRVRSPEHAARLLRALSLRTGGARSADHR